MSGGAEMIAGAVVQRAARMLGDIAWERIQLLWNFQEDAQEMESKMTDLKVAHSYADKRSRETDDDALVLRHWLNKYKSVAYDMEDTLDELLTNAMIWKNSRCTVKLFFSSINPLIVRIAMSHKMRNIRVNLDKIVENQKKSPRLTLPTPTRQDSNENWRETFIGHTDEIEMVGRESEKKEILTKVLLKDGGQESSTIQPFQESSIIPIVGLGGMGKTTLAKAVYTDKETDMFDVKAWVHVSMEFQLNKIVSGIISHVEGSTPAKDADLQNLKSQLDRILCDKLYLIVLDDLWEEGRSKLEKLMNMLQSGKKGSKIIVTTRSEKVRCSGVPLVAKALGYVMQKHCTREEWFEIKNSNILDTTKDDDEGILKGLLLSYYHMPPQLKLCFMYCSMFPKSHVIDHDCLIQQWIALGFIQDTDGQPLQKVAMEYVNELLGMSFLTIFTSPTVLAARMIFKATFRLHMHDMVHELARHVAGDEFSYTNGTENRNTKRDKLNCHYHLLLNQNETSSAYKSLATKVRALHFRGCNKAHLPKQAFSHALCLRVLDLGGCQVSELPSSVYKLKLLKYLDASSLCISNLPKSLNHLLNLQTLILSNTPLKTLPTNIGCLQKLQYFDLSGCANLNELPTSFGDLSSLLFLNLASCHELEALPMSFGDLNRLQFLSLSDCYKLISLPESCCQLHDLAHLDLSDCHNLGKLPDCIDQLSKLEYLNMTSCSKVEALSDSLCKLMMLRHLNLSYCIRLEHLPSCIGDLQLQSLDIEGNFVLQDLPDSIFNMSTLKNVEGTFTPFSDELEKLRKNLKLEGFCKIDGGSTDLCSRITELKKTHYHELQIQGLEDFKHLEGIEHAILLNSLKLTKLTFSWQPKQYISETAHHKTVLGMLVPPRSLHLTIKGYCGIELPKWMLEIRSFLPHLTTIHLESLIECNRLPPLGCLPNLRALVMAEMPKIKGVGPEFYGDYGSCQKLRIIFLISMDNLEEWWTTRSSKQDNKLFLIPNLHLLWASDCPKLKFLPYPLRSMTWFVDNSNHVLPEHGFGNLTSATSPLHLCIKRAPNSPEMWRRAQHLSSITTLTLESIAGLRALPEAIQCFTSLRSLGIKGCVELETLPEFLGDYFTCLEDIWFETCPMLSSLPESIRRLTKLKKLKIINCPVLSEKCQGEDRHKIAHIPELIFMLADTVSRVRVTANWRSKSLDFRWHLSLWKKRKGWLSCRSSLSVAAYQAGLNLGICLSVREGSRWVRFLALQL
uniref:NB-ARC domain-containing protein n=1 Tax=Oryza glumipatula TaxID=40148 RepID=A0A0D9YMB9_9ORYZ